ncbi:MAG: D-aminoacyl-tRNA deacylase, partial [Spirochaetales bacterium]|nr:D-aminoacyl-tRNA deacylase [Spirochaetales bacterium]
MRALVQRVARAHVRVDGETVGAIGVGLLVFLGVTHGDTSHDLDYLAAKIPHLRIFEDETGRMNRSVVDVS